MCIPAFLASDRKQSLEATPYFVSPVALLSVHCRSIWDFPGCSDGKESVCNAGNPGLIPESGRSLVKGLATQYGEFHGLRSLVGY